MDSAVLPQSIIIGDDAARALQKISESLRAKTWASCGLRTSSYSPWLCASPILKAAEMPELLTKGRYVRHEVVHDPGYLAEISNFMQSHRELLLEPLIGDEQDWEIHVRVSDERPEMVDELNALVESVRRTSAFFEHSIPSLLEIVVPLRQPRARGLSCDLFRGVVFLGYPTGYSELNLALDLTHELGHQALGLLRSCDPLFLSDPGLPVFSEVRHTERPALLSLHAASAIAFMLRYALDAGCADHIHPDFNVTLGFALERGLDALTKVCKFTAVGRQVVDEFYELLAELR
jgi:hypothetical protein